MSIRRSITKNIKKNMTVAEVREHAFKAGYKEGLDMGISQTSETFFYMVAYTLDYKLELSQDDFLYLMERICDNIDAYRTGHLTPEDYQTIKKEMKKKGLYYK